MNPSLLLLAAASASPTGPSTALTPVRAVGPRADPRPADRLVLFRRSSRPACPHCGHAHVVGWGSFGVRRRYRCRGCSRTFSDFTASALHGLRRAELWPEFCRCILSGLTVRKAAARVGVHRDTAFRWRHRLLDELRAAERHALGPILFVGEAAVYARHWLVLAVDDHGRAAGSRTGGYRAGVPDLRRLLEGRLERHSTLLSTDGPFGAVARFARLASAGWERRRPIDPRFDRAIERSANYGVRFRRWLRKFRGVSGRYMDNYLCWFRLEEGSLWSGVCRGHSISHTTTSTACQQYQATALRNGR